MTHIDLTHRFGSDNGVDVVRTGDVTRRRSSENGFEFIRDDFSRSSAKCLFIRSRQELPLDVAVTLKGNYEIKRCKLGGWILVPIISGDIYWIPQPARLRSLDQYERILADEDAKLTDLGVAVEALSITFSVPASHAFDCAIWRFEGNSANWLNELQAATQLELQPFFVYASHTSISNAADFYRHIVHGHIYGAIWSWPKKRKICDELDAYALYLIASALEHSTSKTLYGLLRQQVAVSVMSRQDEDGGFRHGEWTEQFESHNRLTNGAAQLLASEVERTQDSATIHALRGVAAYLARQVDHTGAGAWFLHDSLERSEEGMRHYPFAWVPSTWMGKSRTNLLILNTHMDCMLALNRYREVTGDKQYDELLESAQHALETAIQPTPADWLYKPLMRLIGLTLLPKALQVRLALPLRALKRVAWKYIVPKWHKIRARYPRFVMPGGYVERSLGQEGFVHRYHGVHLMDFERYLREFETPLIERATIGLIDYGVDSLITGYWKEDAASMDSLGFWAEGLFMECIRSRHGEHRNLLAAAILDLADARLGLPPSLLGVNAELIAPAIPVPCPSPSDPRIRLVNLSIGNTLEFMAINTSHQPIPLEFEAGSTAHLTWKSPASDQPIAVVPPRGWALGCRPANTPQHAKTASRVGVPEIPA